MNAYTHKCPCVCDRSRNPYVIKEIADPKCRYCGGDGVLTVFTASECPPIPTKIRYAAWAQGTEETGPQGYGETPDEAVADLLSSLECAI